MLDLVYLGMGKMRLLKFLAEAKSDPKSQSEYRLDEIQAQIKPKIDSAKLNLYRIELQEKELIKLDQMRPNAYRITPKGRVYYSSSSWSLLNTNQKIKIIGIITASIISIGLALLGIYLKHIHYI